MFKEFLRLTWSGTGVALAAGALVIFALGMVFKLEGAVLPVQVIFGLGLVAARMAEAIYSRNCRMNRALLEACVLGLAGVLLVLGEETLIATLA